MLGDDTRGSLNGAPCAVAIAPRGYAEHAEPIATIGVASDGSPEAEMALATARRLAAGYRARISALQVASIPVSYTGMVAPVTQASIDALLGQVQEQLDRLEDVDGRAVYGLTGEELAAFGDEVDLLVVGSRGYGPLRRFVLGSTTDYLVRHARCPLLVLPRSSVRAAPATERGAESRQEVGPRAPRGSPLRGRASQSRSSFARSRVRPPDR